MILTEGNLLLALCVYGKVKVRLPMVNHQKPHTDMPIIHLDMCPILQVKWKLRIQDYTAKSA